MAMCNNDVIPNVWQKYGASRVNILRRRTASRTSVSRSSFDDEDSDSGISVDDSVFDGERPPSPHGSVASSTSEEPNAQAQTEVCLPHELSISSAKADLDLVRVRKFTEICAKKDVLLEGLILGALITEPHLYTTLFVLTDKQKNTPYQLDDPRLRFHHVDGDGFTVVAVMRAWCRRQHVQGDDDNSSSSSSEWCKANKILEANLKRITQVVTHRDGLVRRDNTDVPKLKFKDNPQAEVETCLALKKILVNVYRDNICTYRGHESLGYRNISSGGVVHLPVGTALPLLARPTKYIIAFSRHRESSTSLVTCEEKTDSVWGVSLDECEIEDAAVVVGSDTVTPLVLQNIGDVVSDIILKNWKNVVAPFLLAAPLHSEALAISGGSPVIVERCAQRPGTTILHAAPEHHEALQMWMDGSIKVIREHLVMEKIILPYPYSYSEFKLAIDPGSVCTAVVFPGEATTATDSHRGTPEKLSAPLGRNDYCIVFRNSIKIEVACRDHIKLRRAARVTIKSFVKRILDDIPDDKWAVQDVEATKEGMFCSVLLADHYTAWRALTLLDGATCMGLNLEVLNRNLVKRELRTFDIYMQPGVHKVVKELLHAKLENYRLSPKHQLEYKQTFDEQKEEYLIQVVAQSHRDAIVVLQNLTEIMTPEKVVLKKKALQALRKPVGGLYLEHLMHSKNIYVSLQGCHKEMWIYGTKQNREGAANDVSTFTATARFGRTFWHVYDLSETCYPSDLCLRLLREYDFDTTKLSRSLKTGRCYPILSRHLLIMRHPEIVKVKVKKTLKAFIEKEYGVVDVELDAREGAKENEEEQEQEQREQEQENQDDLLCAACCTAPVKDTYILEGCGHVYCLECLQGQVQTALKNTSLPLACAADDRPFTMADLHNVCDRLRVCSLQRLVGLAVRGFVNDHPKDYRFCPKLNCTGLLKTSGSQPVSMCSVCSTRVCPLCFEAYHRGMTCEEYAESFLSVKAWLAEKPKQRKQCKSCAMGIEKVDGCNNVHCVYCKKSICWVCLQVFDDSNACYQHLDASGHWNDDA